MKKLDRLISIRTIIHKRSTPIRRLLKKVYWELRLPKDLNLYLKRWSSIDHRRDKSDKAKDFRKWIIERKREEVSKDEREN